MTASSASGIRRAGPANGTTRCVVVHPEIKGRDARLRLPEARLEEAVGLARAIGLDAIHAEVVNVVRPRPATLLGTGTVARLAEVIAGGGDRAEGPAPVAVIDGALSPVQQRNLERAWNCKVVDRTGLILEIFGARARTREGRLQVELATLTYQRSRLVRTWTHLERQRGGFGFLGGPGETQIEADRRQIGERIIRIRRDLAAVTRTRALHRTARRRVPYAMVALVGYTNAGKSTLFNALTRADVDARDLLFATLDPTMRALKLPSGRIAILSDTVGFVSELPHELVAAFRATLEEVLEADLIVHVRDIHHPDSEAQRQDVHGVLGELGVAEAADGHVIEVLNKSDLLDPEEQSQLAARVRRSNAALILVSALNGDGLGDLVALLDARLSLPWRMVEMRVDPADGALLAWLYRHGEVVERRDADDAIHVKVRLADADAERLAHRRP